MCGIVGIFDTRGRREVSRELRVAHERDAASPRPGRVRPARRAGRRPRPPAAVDHRPVDRPAAAVQRGRQRRRRLQRRDLQLPGADPGARPRSATRFAPRSDTEVIVHAWEAWGEACVERFRGMFAFALWDRNRADAVPRPRPARRKAAVLCAPARWHVRLRLGAQGAARARRLPRDIDPCAVEEYFALGYVPEPRTIFKGAKKLPPAHTLTLRRGAPDSPNPSSIGTCVSRSTGGIDADDATAELAARLEESVRLRMIAEVPLGAFLSGGVDSSAVVAAMAGVSRRSGQYMLDRVCRSGVRRIALSRMQVAERYRTRHFVDRVESEDFDLIDELARTYDEPYADSSAIPTYRVCQLARRHVTVALSGDGGDENFGGYRRYRLHLMEERMRVAAAARPAPPAVRSARARVPEGRLGAADLPREVDVRGARAGFGRRVLPRRLDSARRHAPAAVHRGFQGSAWAATTPSRCSTAMHARSEPTTRLR